MVERVSKRMLEARVEWLNQITKQPANEYTLVDGQFVPNPGNYHLSWAYGGVCVDQMCEGGGTSNVISGYCSKLITYGKLCAYITGVEDTIRQRRSEKRELRVEVHARTAGAIGISSDFTIMYPNEMSDRDILMNMQVNFEPHMSCRFSDAITEGRALVGG